MKKSIVIILFGILLVISFFSIKVSTNIYYLRDRSYVPMVIGVQLKIDDKLVFDDSLLGSPFIPIILNIKLNIIITKVIINNEVIIPIYFCFLFFRCFIIPPNR